MTSLYFVAVVGIAAFLAGWNVSSAYSDAALLESQQDAQAAIERVRAENRLIEIERDNSIEMSAILNAERQRIEKQKQRVIRDEVTVYLPSPDAGKCGVDAVGVRLLNAAASSEGMPEAASETRTPTERP